MDRIRRSRAIARIELGVGAGIVFVVAPVFWVAAPGSTGPQPPAGWTLGLLGVGALGLLTGFAWMLRIRRSHLEPDPRHWRYRR